jgi:hypothetical protein
MGFRALFGMAGLLGGGRGQAQAPTTGGGLNGIGRFFPGATAMPSALGGGPMSAGFNIGTMMQRAMAARGTAMSRGVAPGGRATPRPGRAPMPPITSPAAASENLAAARTGADRVRKRATGTVLGY